MGKDDNRPDGGGAGPAPSAPPSPPASAVPNPPPNATPQPSIVAPSSPARIAPLPAPPDAEYLTYHQPVTQGTITMLVNGRYTNSGAVTDLSEPLDAMQSAVAGLSSGDAVYLSSWFFDPGTPLTRGAVGSATTWGGLLGAQAAAGVIVRVLINDFDPASGFTDWEQNSDITPTNDIINKMAEGVRDNFKYIVCRHPAHVGWAKSLGIPGASVRDVFVGSHHQKFMIVRSGGDLTAFCGGVDIEWAKAPVNWSRSALFNGWNDVHAKLEGPITHDLEKEFVMRWNRDRGGSRRAPLPGWKGYETLGLTPASGSDSSSAKTKHDVQMLRTISTDSTWGPYSNAIHDIEDAYKAGVGRATKYIYIENQYFKSVDLAAWIIAQAKAQSNLVVIIVTDTNGADDPKNALVDHGNWLRHEALMRITNALGPRAGFYTMGDKRKLHTKLIMVDDAWMCVGSANTSGRSFKVDSELNIQTSASSLVADFRTRLWALNLGESSATVGGWAVSDFLSKWNSTAFSNEVFPGRTPPEPDKMVGAAIIPFNYMSVQGTQNGSIPDELTQLDGIKVPNGTTSGGADGGAGSYDAGGGSETGPGSTATA